MSDIKLKPCPFCGGEAHLDKAYSYFRDIVIYCEKCDCVFTPDDCNAITDEVIRAWNTRKPMERIVKQLNQEKFIEQEIILSDVHQGFNAGIEQAIKIIEARGVNIDVFETKSTKPLTQKCTIDGFDSQPNEIQEEKEYPNNQEWKFRKYYHNMSDNQIDMFNHKYSNRVRKLQRAESNERLKEYVRKADKEGCLVEMLQYMEDIFMKGEIRQDAKKNQRT